MLLTGKLLNFKALFQPIPCQSSKVQFLSEMLYPVHKMAVNPYPANVENRVSS